MSEKKRQKYAYTQIVKADEIYIHWEKQNKTIVYVNKKYLYMRREREKCAFGWLFGFYMWLILRFHFILSFSLFRRHCRMCSVYTLFYPFPSLYVCHNIAICTLWHTITVILYSLYVVWPIYVASLFISFIFSWSRRPLPLLAVRLVASTLARTHIDIWIFM